MRIGCPDRAGPWYKCAAGPAVQPYLDRVDRESLVGRDRRARRDCCMTRLMFFNSIDLALCRPAAVSGRKGEHANFAA